MDQLIHSILVYLRDNKEYDMLVALASTAKCYCHYAANVKASNVMDALFMGFTCDIASFPLGFTNISDVMNAMSLRQGKKFIRKEKHKHILRSHRYGTIMDHNLVPIMLFLPLQTEYVDSFIYGLRLTQLTNNRIYDTVDDDFEKYVLERDRILNKKHDKDT